MSDRPTGEPELNLPTYPFLMFGAPVIAGIVAHFFWSPEFLPGAVAISIGIALIVIGSVLGLWSVWTMFRQGEHPEPSHPTKKIIDNGPFGFSRNPSYVALVITALGLGIGLNSIPILISIPFGTAVLALWVVPAEEKYLRQLFGGEYETYCANVRRWL